MNMIPKSNEEIDRLVERNKTIQHKELKRNLKLSGENNSNSSKVESNDGRIWGTVKSCAKELEISEGNLSGALIGRCPFNVKVRHLGLHYKI